MNKKFKSNEKYNLKDHHYVCSMACRAVGFVRGSAPDNFTLLNPKWKEFYYRQNVIFSGDTPLFVHPTTEKS